MTPSEWAFASAIVGVIAGVLLARAFRPRPKLEPPAVTPPPPPTPIAAAVDDAFARLAQALPMGIVLVDAQRRVEFANPAAGAIFGFDAERAIGVHVIEAIPNVEMERRISDALEGEASVAPLNLAGAEGQRVYRVSVSPLAGASHTARWVAVFADDQTALVRLDRARKEFLSNVSHELRTPLSSIKLMLETVLASPDDEARDLFLPQALLEVDRLTALVQQLLEQARAESGQLKLAFREIDLEEVAHPIVASFEPQAATKGIALELLPLRPVTVEADPDRLSQVFVNLIDNAIRHTQSGGRVKIELDARDSDAVVRVRDNGEGIPYRDVPHIFERFYVVDRSRRRESGGAGLGLAIVKGIVDAHGGAISAESMLGRGTTFTIRLPIMRIKREA
ncbi:MAG: PAS domain-containing protein [Candidatus Eremiobacteraeota bacterium]|nr:PAS domain-containing protein [Candidatus Eremiobacteraeota bacterium]MBV8372435.1 PAS domain-containing protein [Candidatus Eremiobacteraeota bacterium]